MKENTSLDEIDNKIVLLCSKNGKISAREMAKKIGVTVTTVITRINKLEKTGIIKGYTAILDHEKLGYELTVLVEIIVSKGKLLEVENQISVLPNTCAVYDITGETDGLVIAKFKSREDLSSFIKKILSFKYVERTNTHVVLTTIKENFNMV